MKRLKKILAVALAMAMVVAMALPAMAASTTNNVTPDKKVTISGLEAGDTVKYYKVIEWVDSTGWAFTTDFAGLATSGMNGQYVIGANDTEKSTRPTEFPTSVLNYITGLPEGFKVKTDTNGVPIGVEADSTKPEVLGRINSLLAAKIAEIAKTKNAKHTDGPITGTTSEYGSEAADGTPIEPGLYVALVDAGKTGVMYNPIFVSADFSQTEVTGAGDTKFNNAWAVTTGDSYSDTAVAKKSDITVTKEVTDSDTTPAQDSSKTVATADVGEVLDFKITTQMPEYADNYTWAKFKVSDTLSNGLKTVLDTNNKLTIKVGNDTFEFASADAVAAANTVTTGTPAVNVFNSITFADEGTSILVDFTSAYILSQTGKQNVEITYKAEVTTAAYHNVDETKNEVQVEYSNNPASETDTGIIKDVTTHYTFSLDALLNGEETGGYNTSELIKVGVDSDGKWLTQTNLETYNNGAKAYPLGGAVFGLFTSSEAAAAAVGKTYDQLATANGIYTNAYYQEGDRAVARFTTDDKGKLDVRGLDAGTYYLVETKAPAGFIADTTVKTIVITPTYKEVTVNEEVKGIVIQYTSKVLDYYTVAVTSGSDTVTSKYTVDYDTPTWKDESATPKVATEGTGIKAFTALDSTSAVAAGKWLNHHEETERETIVKEADQSTFLANTQGTELPSTGGIGTTIFYVVGALLVIGAGVVLVTRRRMDA